MATLVLLSAIRGFIQSKNNCMKKLYALFCLMFFTAFSSFAVTVIIEVVDYQFSPANPTVNVDDVVRFHFADGYHNVTSQGDAIPNGANAIYSGGPSESVRNYSYTATVPGVYNYYCEVHGGPGGAGMAGKFTVTDPLPVTLSNFDVQAQPGKSPLLTWTTLTETNVSHFSLRSSTDGSHYKEVAKLPAKGNSTSEQQYNVTDKNSYAAYRFVFYQLLVVDKDGKQTYSNIRMYKTSFAANKLVVQMGPNPIKRPGQLVIQFNAENAGLMPVNVYDAGGKQVLKTTMRAMPGLNNGHIHVCDLAPGMYTLQFSYEGMKETRKLVVE